MSVLDKAIAAVTPAESGEDRTNATMKARARSSGRDWLALVLDHHEQLRTAFALLKAYKTADAQSQAQEQLKVLLMGHAIAEEAVLYPALALSGEKSHAEMGYDEQSTVKIEMAALGNLPYLSRDYMDKLEKIEQAVLHHMFEEEGTWFVELKDKGSHQEKLTDQYLQEFNRYVGHTQNDSARI
jgi:hemerythrin superfamily protein